MLWVEQPWNVHPRKLDRKIFEDGPSAKIGSLENFWPYGIHQAADAIRTVRAVEIIMVIQLSLQTKDTLRTGLLSFVRRLSLSRKFATF